MMSSVAIILQRKKSRSSSTWIKCIKGKKISCAKSDELPVSLLHICYVDSLLEKCFVKFIAEGYLISKVFFFFFPKHNWERKTTISVQFASVFQKSSQASPHFSKERRKVACKLTFLQVSLLFGLFYSILSLIHKDRFNCTDAAWRVIPKNM